MYAARAASALGEMSRDPNVRRIVAAESPNSGELAERLPDESSRPHTSSCSGKQPQAAITVSREEIRTSVTVDVASTNDPQVARQSDRVRPERHERTVRTEK